MIDPVVLAVLASLRVPEAKPTPKQVRCIAEVVYREARGEPPIVQTAVAYTVIDRGGTPCTTVHRKHQFARAVRHHQDPHAWRRSVETAVLVASRVLDRPTGKTKIIAFHDDSVHPNWRRNGWRIIAVYNHMWFWGKK